MPSVSTVLIILAVIACVLALLVIAVCLATAARLKNAVEHMKKHPRKRK